MILKLQGKFVFPCNFFKNFPEKTSQNEQSILK